MALDVELTNRHDEVIYPITKTSNVKNSDNVSLDTILAGITDTKTTQTNSQTNAYFPMLFANQYAATYNGVATTEITDKVLKAAGNAGVLTYNPSLGKMYVKSATTTGEPGLFVSNATHTIALMIGSGAVNRGIYDVASNGWMVYKDSSTIYLNGQSKVVGDFVTTGKVYFTGISSGTSNVVDGTEFLTSYADANGFSTTNSDGKNQVYKRKATCLYNYIKGKTDLLYKDINWTPSDPANLAKTSYGVLHQTAANTTSVTSPGASKTSPYVLVASSTDANSVITPTWYSISTSMSSTSTNTDILTAKCVYDVLADNERVFAASLNDLNTRKENVENKVTSIASTSTDVQYPSALAVYNYIESLNKWVLKTGDTMSGGLTIQSGGLTVTSGGATITAGGLSVNAGTFKYAAIGTGSDTTERSFWIQTGTVGVPQRTNTSKAKINPSTGLITATSFTASGGTINLTNNCSITFNSTDQCIEFNFT